MVRMLDFLIAVLILFPLFTGGIWIKKPGLFLELSELGVPVLIVSLYAAIARLGFRAPLEESCFARLGARTWRRWCAWLDRDSAQALAFGAFVSGFMLAVVALRKHWA